MFGPRTSLPSHPAAGPDLDEAENLAVLPFNRPTGFQHTQAARMLGVDAGPENGADPTTRAAWPAVDGTPLRGPPGRHGPRKFWIWSGVLLAAALTLTATFTLVPIPRGLIYAKGTAFLELSPPANGTIPGQGVILGFGGEFCPLAPRDSNGFTGSETFTLSWATVNGTRLPNFNVYVPSYMGILPGTYVYSVANSSQGNFSQQVQGAGALCNWALDFGATFASYDRVILVISTATTYVEEAPLI